MVASLLPVATMNIIHLSRKSQDKTGHTNTFCGTMILRQRRFRVHQITTYGKNPLTAVEDGSEEQHVHFLLKPK
jgi:hypothetical protein